MADPKEQPPAHWAGTVPQRILAPDGTAVGDPDVGLDPVGLRELLRLDDPSRAPRPGMHRPAAPGRAGRLPAASGQEAAQVGSASALGADGLGLPLLPRAGGGAGPRRRPGRVPRSLPGDLARRDVRPARHRFGPIVRPGRHPDRCTPSATRWAQQLDGDESSRSRTSATARPARATSTRRATSPGVWRAGRVLLPEQPVGDQRAAAEQTAGAIWRRAEGYGFPGVRVDGNDVLAVYARDAEAAERARARRAARR